MSTNFVDRKNDEEIIDLVNSIFSNGKMQVETINEAVLVKLMEIRNTPIKYDKSYRDIDKDFERWQSEQLPDENLYQPCEGCTTSCKSWEVFFCKKLVGI
jgi:hypothetical protein